MFGRIWCALCELVPVVGYSMATYGVAVACFEVLKYIRKTVYSVY